MKKYFVIHISFFLVLFISCDDVDQELSQDLTDTTFVDFRNVENYGTFDITVKGTTIVTTESHWLGLWRLYWNWFDGNGNRMPPPEMDFNQDMVIGIFWGDECTYSGCSNKSPSIKDLFIIHDTLFVSIDELVYLGDCAACVHPLHMIETGKLDIPVKFIGNIP